MNTQLKFCCCSVLVVALLISGCDDKPQQPEQETLNETQWQQEIQKRFDILNQMAGGVECITLDNIKDFPYQVRMDYQSSQEATILRNLNEINLLSESMEEEAHPYYENETVIFYKYDLTDLGKQYFKKWTQLDSSGFCFGHITVGNITKIESPQKNNYSIHYDYIIDNVPPDMSDFMSKQYGSFRTDIKPYSFISIGINNKEIHFELDEHQRLFCKKGCALIVH